MLPGPIWLFGPFRRLFDGVAAWESWLAATWANLRPDAIIRDVTDTGVTRHAYSPTYLRSASQGRFVLIVKDSGLSDAEREFLPPRICGGELH